jgi:hypothetical protein
MRAVIQNLADRPMETSFVQIDQIIQTFPVEESDHSVLPGILPRRFWRRRVLPPAQAHGTAQDLGIENAATVAQEKPWRGCEREGN